MHVYTLRHPPPSSPPLHSHTQTHASLVDCSCRSPDLHAQLLRLASTLLVKHTPSAATLASAAAAADRAVVEAWAKGGRQQPQQPKLTPRLGGVPEEFGGLQVRLRCWRLSACVGSCLVRAC